MIGHIVWDIVAPTTGKGPMQTLLAYVTVINIHAPHHASTANPLSPKLMLLLHITVLTMLSFIANMKDATRRFMLNVLECSQDVILSNHLMPFCVAYTNMPSYGMFLLHKLPPALNYVNDMVLIQKWLQQPTFVHWTERLKL
jgi:hypothetical protein